MHHAHTQRSLQQFFGGGISHKLQMKKIEATERSNSLPEPDRYQSLNLNPAYMNLVSTILTTRYS